MILMDLTKFRWTKSRLRRVRGISVTSVLNDLIMCGALSWRLGKGKGKRSNPFNQLSGWKPPSALERVPSRRQLIPLDIAYRGE